MARSIDVEAGARKRHVKVNGVAISRAAYAALRIAPGDQITITPAWTPAVMTELLPGEEIVASVAGEPPDDAVLVADDVVGWDLGNTVNGHPWLWWVSLCEDWDPVPRPVDFARAATINVSSDWGGSWDFTLMYGSGFARLADEEDGAEVIAAVVPQSVSLNDALIALADRANHHEALSHQGRRRFSMCKICANAGVGSVGREDGEEAWDVTCEADSRCDDPMKAQLLGALWSPCLEHQSIPIAAFSKRWSWKNAGWTVAKGQ